MQATNKSYNGKKTFTKLVNVIKIQEKDPHKVQKGDKIIIIDISYTINDWSLKADFTAQESFKPD